MKRLPINGLQILLNKTLRQRLKSLRLSIILILWLTERTLIITLLSLLKIQRVDTDSLLLKLVVFTVSLQSLILKMRKELELGKILMN